MNVSTSILGLTVLAVGNSVGDWVADTSVARAG
jgi:Ca2+/Na+ antiporter